MNRVGALDGLRAIAVLIVMVSHAELGDYVPGGFGVTIFFFLSGYLITTLMVAEWHKTGRLDLYAFYVRRSVRIIPPMLLCIAVTVLLSQLAIQPRPITYEGLGWDLIFLSNYVSSFGVNSLIPIPLWSLNVEEHFYLLFPAVFIAVSMARPAALPAVIGALITGALLLRIATPEHLRPMIYYWSHTRMDSILFGCLLAVINNPVFAKSTDMKAEQKTWVNGSALWFGLGLALILISLLYREPIFRDTWRYTVQSAGLWLVFNYILRSRGWINRFLEMRVFKKTGEYSYVLYLIHLPLFVTAAHWLEGMPQPIIYALGAVASYGFAAASMACMERPLARWRAGFLAKRQPQTASFARTPQSTPPKSGAKIPVRTRR
jgi:peptidoglycan/LPS O-acetylase OafA/YrhL